VGLIYFVPTVEQMQPGEHRISLIDNSALLIFVCENSCGYCLL